ncbi:MAG: hypothetical protein MJB57_17175 [Gemmatimonadetes bacterium]|nr:hypothetical protein [Gemmatimonadota bacterium]
MEVIAPMVVLVTLIVTVGAVRLFRPLTKRMGDLLELRMKQARGEIEDPQAQRMEALLETISSRLSLLEERQDFTDSLLQSRRAEARELPTPKKESWE